VSTSGPVTTFSGTPEVIVDFIFDDGLFFVAVQNISASPAFEVSVKFDKEFSGVEGTKIISSLPLFRRIPFLAPQKSITAYLDTSASYFRRRQPTKLVASLTWKDASGAKCAAVIRHDLAIYKDLGYIRRAAPANGGHAEGNELKCGVRNADCGSPRSAEQA
jgi:hypothetical protein